MKRASKSNRIHNTKGKDSSSKETDKIPKINSFNRRTGMMKAFFLLLLMVVLGRAVHLQFFEKAELEAIAERQHNQTLSAKLQRGPIYDSQGNILTVSLPMDSVFVIPAEVKRPRSTAQQLSRILRTRPDRILNKLTAKSSFVWIQRNLKPSDSKRIKALELEGIYHLTEYQRFYPLRHHAAHLIGFSGIDSQGLEGLEYQYDEHLMAGTSRHSVIKSLYSPPELNNLYGGSLKLTINSKLQYFAEEELSRAVQQMEAKHGVAIIMESQTGRILSMVTIPDYDPNNFEHYPPSTYFNRAVSASYEPGSTFKVITISAALQNQVIQGDEYFFCEKGEYQIQDRVIHDIRNYGWLSIEQIIQKSSNICAAKIGQLIPKSLFYKTIREFGFGQKTGVNLPGEATGKVYNYQDWSATDVATMSFGHTIAATPIQLITAINALATGGVLITPTVIEEARNANGNRVQLTSRYKKRILDASVAETVKHLMISVTQKGGTGYSAHISDLKIAGKTGTSRKFDFEAQAYSTENHITSFVGFFPAENPKLTILVLIDEPEKPYLGTKSPAPVFKRIALKALHLYPERFPVQKLAGTLPSVPHLFHSSEPLALNEKDANKSGFPDQVKYKTFREALKIADKFQVDLEASGSGIVRSVKPDRYRRGLYHVELR